MVASLVILLVFAVWATVYVESIHRNLGPSGDCVSVSHTFVLSAPITESFQDCLPTGGTQGYGYSESNHSVSILNGTVSSEFPIRVQILSNPLSEAVGVLYSQNDTRSANFSEIGVVPYVYYAIYVTNLGNNNSISVNLQFS